MLLTSRITCLVLQNSHKSLAVRKDRCLRCELSPSAHPCAIHVDSQNTPCIELGSRCPIGADAVAWGGHGGVGGPHAGARHAEGRRGLAPLRRRRHALQLRLGLYGTKLATSGTDAH